MSNNGDGKLPDMQAFHSRLALRGTLTLSTGLRVGAGRGSWLEGAELPVIKTADGRPYIPGTSFKGAWRATTEALLRGLPGAEDKNLACLSVPRDEKTVPPEVCLTSAAATQLKARPTEEWGEVLSDRLTVVSDLALDDALRALSCWTCRVFGAPWLAGKVLIRDLPLLSSLADTVEPQVRDGVAIDRDKGSASPKRKFAYQVVPAGTAFAFEVVIENASEAELGLAWLGLTGFQRGEIPLGGARSRGLGRCQLLIDWDRSQWLTQDNLLESLFPEDLSQLVGVLGSEGSEVAQGWWQVFRSRAGLEGS